MKIWTKGINWFLAALLGLLGFSGCETASAPEYGLPPTEYLTVKGTVVDKATGKPIRGIRVGYGIEPTVIPMYGVPSTPCRPLVHVETNAQGKFELPDIPAEELETIHGRRIMPLFVDDIDGAANGSFRSESLQVDFGKDDTVIVKVELTEYEAK